MKYLLALALLVMMSGTAIAQDAASPTFYERWKQLQSELISKAVERSGQALGTPDRKTAEVNLDATANDFSVTTLSGIHSGEFVGRALAGIKRDYVIESMQAHFGDRDYNSVLTRAAVTEATQVQFLVAAQNQVIIDQNAQIIALLQKIAGQK
jgi:hypothetical protein